MRQLTPLDSFILEIDNARKTLLGLTLSARPSPADQLVSESLDDQLISEQLTPEEKNRSRALMRVNHCGEVCAQALYRGQAFTCQQFTVKAALYQAASEEQDHLNWCAARITELGGRTSVLNPLFYGVSFALGSLLGRLSEDKNLGFVEATEAQVCAHLKQHLEQLPQADEKSRVVLNQMLEDEKRHGDQAIEAGGQIYPAYMKQAMSQVAKLMTKTTFYL